MNPLTLVKRIQNINSREADLGLSDEASWHAIYKDSAYVFVGGIPYDLTEGDLLAVFAQYGEIVDVNLVKDKGTGKSKGFAFLAYEDQRSTTLAVDNLNGATVGGRIIRVDHVTKYKKKEEDDEETARQKREARGVCRAFQKGECTRGAGCKFSHDEQRAANTGWGPRDNSERFGHDKSEGPKWGEKRSISQRPSDIHLNQRDRRNDKSAIRPDIKEIEQKPREGHHWRDDKRPRRHEDNEFERKRKEDSFMRDEKRSRRHENNEFESREDHQVQRNDETQLRRREDGEFESKSRQDNDNRDERRLRKQDDDEFESKSRQNDNRRDDRSSRRQNGDEFELRTRQDDYSYRRDERRSRGQDAERLDQRAREYDDRKEERRLKRPESESYVRENWDKRGGDRNGKESDYYKRKSER